MFKINNIMMCDGLYIFYIMGILHSKLILNNMLINNKMVKLMLIIGIGNILQKDDGLGVYASTYLKENYIFYKDVNIVNGGVEGINLFGLLSEHKNILILDTLNLEDTPASIYLIPSKELRGYGLNSGGAHEIGILQCLDMMELQGKEIPKTTVLGVTPKHITFDIDLSFEIKNIFQSYINIALKFIEKEGVNSILKDSITSLEEIIQNVKRL
jgi:hydrogenase maturation protease